MVMRCCGCISSKLPRLPSLEWLVACVSTWWVDHHSIFLREGVLWLRCGSTSILADGKKQIAETWRKKKKRPGCMPPTFVAATSVGILSYQWHCGKVFISWEKWAFWKSFFFRGCLLFSVTSALPAVRTEEESLLYESHVARAWIYRILLKEL